jgi:hypothetical protein
MTNSPWDDSENAILDDPVSGDPADAPSAPESESETWRRRAHELWAQAQRDGNVAGQAAAINSALRHLKADAEAATKANANVQGGISEETRKQIQRDALDGAVRAFSEHQQKHRMLCPACHGQGDRLRIRRFEKWLDEQGTKVAFDDWNVKTPYAMSGTLEEKAGFYLDDEVSTSNTN